MTSEAKDVVIYKQVAIDAIKSKLLAFTPTQMDMKEDCLEIIEKLPSVQLEHRWIPCSETEPKKSGYYLCTHGGTTIVSPDYYTTQEQAEEMFADPEDEYLDLKEYIGWASKDVIAWMPLPEPYREEGDKRWLNL